LYSLTHIILQLIPVFVTEENSVKSQLRRIGILPGDVKFVIISHFHADHISGVSDFKNATYVFSQEGYKYVSQMWKINAVRHGFIEGLLPPDFLKRSMCLDNVNFEETSLPSDLLPFTTGFTFPTKTKATTNDLFLIPLAGHCKGHLGLIVKANCKNQISHVETSAIHRNQWYFFVGDACWSSHSINDLKLPHWLTRLFVHYNWSDYIATIRKLHQLREQNPLHIIPSHCSIELNRYSKL